MQLPLLTYALFFLWVNLPTQTPKKFALSDCMFLTIANLPLYSKADFFFFDYQYPLKKYITKRKATFLLEPV